MNKLLVLKFKGSRTYLHGSDFYNALSEAAEELTGAAGSFVSRLTIRRPARSCCEITEDRPDDPAKLVGQVRFRLPDEETERNFLLVETDVDVSDRYAFDETVVSDRVILDRQKASITLAERSVYTPVEDIILLTKCLSYAMSPLENGNWLFGQVDLGEDLNDAYTRLEVRMINLIDARFSVHDILIDDRRVGTIRFIVGQVE